MHKERCSENESMGKIVSLSWFLFLFGLLPSLIKIYWSSLLDSLGSGFLLYWSVINSAFFLVFLTYNVTMYFVYTRKWEFLERYRANEKLWPWEENKQKWLKILPQSLFLILFNNLIVGNLLMLTSHYIDGQVKVKTSIEDWPNFITILWQFVFFILVEDALFFWGHWALHRPYLYWIHKKHHEYTVSVSLAAIHTHPIEYILTGALPSGLGFMILANQSQVHLVTVFCWLVFRFIQAFEGHCGYNWSWGQLSFFPWRVKPEYHDFHHSHNVGNYVSMFTFWDWLIGTNHHFQDYKKQQKPKKIIESNSKQTERKGK